MTFLIFVVGIIIVVAVTLWAAFTTVDDERDHVDEDYNP